MNRVTKAEIQQTIADREYWIKVAEILDCTLVGWSYRHSCTLRHESETIQIHGWLAEHLLRKFTEKSI